MSKWLIFSLFLLSLGLHAMEGGGSGGNGVASHDPEPEEATPTNELLFYIPIFYHPTAEATGVRATPSREGDGKTWEGTVEIDGDTEIVIKAPPTAPMCLEPGAPITVLLSTPLHEGISFELWLKKAIQIKDIGTQSYLLRILFNASANLESEIGTYFAQLPHLAETGPLAGFLETLEAYVSSENLQITLQIIFSLIDRAVASTNVEQLDLLLNALLRMCEAEALDAPRYFALAAELTLRLQNFELYEHLLNRSEIFSEEFYDHLFNVFEQVVAQLEQTESEFEEKALTMTTVELYGQLQTTNERFGHISTHFM